MCLSTGQAILAALAFLVAGWAACLAWDCFLDWLYEVGWVVSRVAMNVLAIVGVCTVGWLAYSIAT